MEGKITKITKKDINKFEIQFYLKDKEIFRRITMSLKQIVFLKNKGLITSVKIGDKYILIQNNKNNKELYKIIKQL